ncbi:hypothetical protein N9N13_02290 [Opitutales bacterium]|jgi:hypothetical protein|nr:hypothetical protein [Opitutales bacterium]
MLKKLTNHALIDEQDRVRYLDESMSVTLWFNEDNSIFGFEVIFDLLLREKSFIYNVNSRARYGNMIEENPKFGRNIKRTMDNFNAEFTLERLSEFESKSKYIPEKEREFILKIMHDNI